MFGRLTLSVGLLLGLGCFVGCHIRLPSGTSVIYVVDVSDSIPMESRGRAVDFINRSSKLRSQGDSVGVIIFGADAGTEIALSSDVTRVPGRFESLVPSHGSNIASAIDLAVRSLPSTGTRRIVLVTDGNETDGDGVAAARRAIESGIEVDVVPIRYRKRDAIVDFVKAPPDVAIDQSFEIEVSARTVNADKRDELCAICLRRIA